MYLTGLAVKNSSSITKGKVKTIDYLTPLLRHSFMLWFSLHLLGI